MEQTIALIKPDGVARRMIGHIILDIESYNELSIAHLQTMTWSLGRARAFYSRQHEGKPYFDELCEFMSSGPLVGMVLEGADVISKWRLLMGPNDSHKREPFQIRAKYQAPNARMMENLVHGSDSKDSFDHESAILSRVFI